jgi:uncharacterized delta-60 repeat protein
MGLDSGGSPRTGVFRLNPDGSADATFSEDGLAVLEVSGTGEPDVEVAHDGAVAVGGKLVVPGEGGLFEGDAFVALLTAEGQLAAGFGNGGLARIVIPGSPDDIELEPRAAGGWAITGQESEPPFDFHLFALTADGALDPSFSGDGKVTTDLSGVRSEDWAEGIGVAPDGSLLVAGTADGWVAQGRGQLPGTAIVRYLDTAGPADADADHVLDAVDACPNRFGGGRTGCLEFRPPHIRIAYRPAVTDFAGHVSFRPAFRCARGVVVKVFRKQPGPDRLIGRSEPAGSPEGHWEVSALAPPGLYYARSVPRLVPEVGYCAGGTSAVVRRG